MKLTLYLPGLLWPDHDDGPDVSKDLALPALAQLLARGKRRHLPASPSQLLCQAFSLSQLSLAASLAQASGLPTDGRHWLLLEPVHLRVDRDRALLADVGIMQLTQDEANALINSLGQLLAEDGFTCHAPTPQRWFLSLPAASGATFTPLPDVIGADINPHLPRGDKGMLWSRYLNEMQMLLYSHPVNDAREARGEPTVNSVWLWGEQGATPLRPTLAHDALYADGELWQQLAALAGQTAEAAPYAFSGLPQAGQHPLLVLDALESPAQYRDAWGWREALQRLERDWFAPLLQALRQRRLSQLTVCCDGDAGFELTLTPLNAWKFWRSPCALERLYPQ